MATGIVEQRDLDEELRFKESKKKPTSAEVSRLLDVGFENLVNAADASHDFDRLRPQPERARVRAPSLITSPSGSSAVDIVRKLVEKIDSTNSNEKNGERSRTKESDQIENKDQQNAEAAPESFPSYAAVCARGISKEKDKVIASTPTATDNGPGAEEKLCEQPQQNEWDCEWETSAAYKPQSINNGRSSNPEDMLHGQGAWKPIVITNMRAAKRAVNNCRRAS